MSNQTSTETRKFKIVASFDTDAPNPREDYDHVGTMCLFHRRLDLVNEGGLSVDDTQRVAKNVGVLGGVVLPVFMYEHSGTALSTTPFSCPCDSGQAGVIYVTEEKCAQEYGSIKFDSREDRDRHIANVLISEVAEYGQWLNGEVAFIRAVDEETGEELDSLGGVYGGDAGIMEHAEGMLGDGFEFTGSIEWI